MNTNEHAHAQRPKFDTLFADPRHYRGDCRLMVTAIRRGWLKDAPQADRDALAARFHEAMRERWTTEPAESKPRALFAEVAAMLAMDRDNTAQNHRALCYEWAGELTDRNTGRPRERWHVSDYRNRIDANELRRRAKADGMDLRTLHAIDVRPALPPDKPDDHGWGGERIALAVVADRRYGWRVWLVCPRCKCRRAHLYPVRAGVRCRTCARIAYGIASAGKTW